ncbi:MAG: SLBB domain-containing protein [Gammaproteobacteria bacterium]|nr:SLBB domain-containing protein [Gammaproteobacteria bacterium]
MRLLLNMAMAVMLGLMQGATFAAPTPTAQQLQMFNSLSTSEQQQVLKMMGKSGDSFGNTLLGGVGTGGKNVAGSDKKTGSQKSQSEESTDPASPDLRDLRDLRFAPGDSLIVRYIPKADLLPRELLPPAKNASPGAVVPDRPQELYVLDKYGVLNLTYAPPIPLAGLDEEQASLRVALEPVFDNYFVIVTKLHLQPQGKEALKPFGYELFKAETNVNGMDESSSMSVQMPVPSDYVVGPGDTVNVQLFGKENQLYELEVSREGSLLFPGVGAISVVGMSFSELKRDLSKRIQNQFIGVEAQVSMGQLRTIQVFVTGEVAKPGSYLVGALSTMTQVLSTAGGMTEIASMRNVSLKRKGRLIQDLDLYELLLNGNSSSDLRLQSGDVVHVPALSRSVSIIGEIRRPAIYQLRGKESLKDLFQLAGGLTADAFELGVRIERVVEGGARKVLSVEIAKASSVVLQDGDLVQINAVASRVEKYVQLTGWVDRPGRYQWAPDMRVSQLLGRRAQMDPQTDFSYSLVKRYGTDTHLEVTGFDLGQALDNPGSDADLKLQARDEVVVFATGQNRQIEMTRIVTELRKQARSDNPALLVRLHGQVHSPGEFPLTPGMRVSDLLRAGGMLLDSAHVMEAELTRFSVDAENGRQISHMKIELQSVLRGERSADITLQPYDVLTIKEIPQWEERDSVEVAGEVRFPGRYPIRRGETLSELIVRAGGFTDHAYIQGAVFMREELREREQKQLDAMAANLEAELAAVALQRSGEVSQVSTAGMANDLLGKLKTVKAAGRLVIHLDAVKASLDSGRRTNTGDDIVLQGGDKLFIPGQMQEVTVLGEVFHPTSHLYRSGADIEKYLDASGGMTNKADAERVYVIKANGSVQLAKRSWLEPQVNLSPGDTVIVPFDSEKVSSLKLWTDVSQIVYQLGLSVAAWKNVGLLAM